MRWEYIKIDLNDHSAKMDDITILSRAGAEGWELIAISITNIAYLKRPLADTKASVRSKG